MAECSILPMMKIKSLTIFRPAARAACEPRRGLLRRQKLRRPRSNGPALIRPDLERGNAFYIKAGRKFDHAKEALKQTNGSFIAPRYSLARPRSRYCRALDGNRPPPRALRTSRRRGICLRLGQRSTSFRSIPAELLLGIHGRPAPFTVGSRTRPPLQLKKSEGRDPDNDDDRPVATVRDHGGA